MEVKKSVKKSFVIDPKDTVLLFKTTGPAYLASRLHAPSCPMLRTAKRGGSVHRVDAPDQAENDDLNERGFPVCLCKCLKGK